MIFAGKEAGRRHLAPPGGAGWLALAAAPTFAGMALAAWATGGDAETMCPAMHASPLGGMVPMYLLMSAFHSAPWLSLLSRR